MGTDIHFYVERYENGKWVSCDKWGPDSYAEDDGKGPRLSVGIDDNFYGDRSYDTFAILAGVRNGAGFAGCDTGDGFVPIAEPRGLPDDMSPQLATEVARYLEHTPSWLLLSELMTYDWTQTTTKRGWITALEYARWNKRSNPQLWYGKVDGPSIQHLTAEEMDEKISALRNEFPKIGYHDFNNKIKERLSGAYCQVLWDVHYYQAASGFISEVLPRLWRLGKYEDVRCVFWFDS